MVICYHGNQSCLALMEGTSISISSLMEEVEIWGQGGYNKLKSRKLGELSGGPVVIRTRHFYFCGSRFNLWLGELKSHMTSWPKKQNIKHRNSIVTNSIKALKMAHIKK